MANTVNFVNPRARFLDENGDPLSGGTVEFYEAGTATLKDVYSNEAGTVLAPNPNTLDSEGYVEDATGVRLGEGKYDIVVKRSTGATYFTYPNVQGVEMGGAGATTTIGYVDTIAALADLPDGAFDMVYVNGYYSAYDGGGRWMKWNTTDNTTDNGGTVISPSGSPALGRWNWLPDVDDLAVTPQLFGAFPSDGSLVVATQVDAMISWSTFSDYRTIHFNLPGEYWVNSSSIFPSNVHLIIDEGVQFKSSSGSISITLNSDNATFNTRSQIVFPAPTGTSSGLVLNGAINGIEANPAWWGAYAQGATDLGFSLAQMVAQVSTDIPIRFMANDTSEIFSIGSNTVDLSQHSVIFDNVQVALTGGTLTLGAWVENHNTDSFVITGANLGDLKFNNSYCPAGLVDFGNGTNVIVSGFTDFIATNTENGTRKFYCEFGTYPEQSNGTYDFGIDLTRVGQSNDYHMYFIWDIKLGYVLKTVNLGKIEFGGIVAGPYQLFDSASVQYSLRFSEDQDFRWYGAIEDADSNAANALAFKCAYTQNVYSNTGDGTYDIDESFWLVLNGSYELDEVSTSSNVSSNRGMIKQGQLRGPDAITGNWLALYYGARFEDVKLTSNSTSATNLLLASFNNFCFRNCELYSKSKLWTNGATNTLTNEIYDSILTCSSEDTTTINALDLYGGDTIINNCEMIRNPITTNEGLTYVVLDQDTDVGSFVMTNCRSDFGTISYGEGDISNNRFTGARIEVSNPGAMSIKGNSITTSGNLDAGIYFRPIGLNNTVTGLDCQGNTFVDGVSDPATRVDYDGIDLTGIDASNTFTSTGHRCTIRDNYGNRQYLSLGTNVYNGNASYSSLTGNTLYAYDLTQPNATGGQFIILPKSESIMSGFSAWPENVSSTGDWIPRFYFGTTISPSNLGMTVSIPSGGSFTGNINYVFDFSGLTFSRDTVS